MNVCCRLLEDRPCRLRAFYQLYCVPAAHRSPGRRQRLSCPQVARGALRATGIADIQITHAAFMLGGMGAPGHAQGLMGDSIAWQLFSRIAEGARLQLRSQATLRLKATAPPAQRASTSSSLALSPPQRAPWSRASLHVPFGTGRTQAPLMDARCEARNRADTLTRVHLLEGQAGAQAHPAR